MASFAEIRERAENRKGGADGLKALMPKAPNHDALRALPDDRILSEMTRYIFYAGFVRNVINAKWTGFETAFSGFDPAFLNLAPDDYWHDLTSDGRVIRNGAKIMSVRANAQFVRRLADEHGSAGRFFADWPLEDQVGLLAVLDKQANRLGGMTGQYLLRAIGRDSFVMSHDVLVCLRLSGVPVSESKPTKKDLRLIQDQFNAWHAETGLPLTYLSRICAFSVGMPGEEDEADRSGSPNDVGSRPDTGRTRMTTDSRPLAISAPEPRSLELIFTGEALSLLHSKYRIVEVDPENVAGLGDAVLGEARYIIGQPPLSKETLDRMPQLRCILNVESNLINNMPYEVLFERGIHVVTTGQVFAEPVAEIGLGFALSLARGISDADLDFREGRELWGGDGNAKARLVADSDIGIVGFGDLGKALNRVLSGFRANIRVFDPWMPPSILREHGVQPAGLDEVLSGSDFIFVVASVTSENRGFLGANAFAKMREGAAFILLSRADVVDFDALMAAVASGHIVAASDVYPEEPLGLDHPVRKLKGFLRSAHRAGALDSAFKKMGDMVLEDMDLMDRGLPPMRCKRAERETVSRMRSKPVSRN